MTAFLDTGVLVYAQSADPKGEIARRAILAGGVISVQVVNEFTSVLRRKFRLDWHAIAGAVADLRTALDPVRPVSIDTWASAVEAGCRTLLTEDLQAGRRIDGLTVVNPFDR